MKHIIIADDDPGIRDVFDLILKRAGYDVTIFPQGEPILKGQYKLPHLFIIDKQLSGVDGLAVCKFLKHNESTRKIPIIMTSASPYVERLAAEAGADDFIEKPFSIQTLINLIEKLLTT